MARKADVPNAWDDDWEAEADQTTAKQSKQSKPRRIDDAYNDDENDTPFSGGALLTQPSADYADTKEKADAKPVLLSRAERLAQHAEKNRKLWETADNPEEFHFLSAGPSTNTNGSSGPTILASASAFRPTMTVLSRKPAPQMIRRRDPVTGLEQLTMSDDAAEAEAEAEARAAAARKQETPEQIRVRQLKEREERQRKYNEARAKIFGETVGGNNGGNGSGVSGSGNNTPSVSSRQTSPTPKSGNSNNQNNHNHNTPLSPQSHNNRRGRGRGQGQGGQSGQSSNRGGNNNGQGNRGYHHHSNSNNGQLPVAGHGSPSSNHASSQKLFDPNYSPKPGSRRQGGQNLNGLSRNNSNGNSNGNSNEASPFPSRTATPREDNDFVTRAPKGPDGTGRGGFGFSRRGG